MADKHVVLAFSGGLDTSFCVAWLREQGYRVTTATIDTGGFDAAELERIAGASTSLGAEAHHAIDARERLFERYLRFLVFGNVLRGGTYPLSVSAERVCQAECVVDVARNVGASALAHGSTGAGNDQVRFDVAFAALASDLELITPIRALALSRADEAAYLAARGVDVPARTREYSVNEGMWGSSVGGRETLESWPALPDAVYPGGAVDAPAPRTMVISYEAGVPVALDGDARSPVAMIEALNEVGRRYGIGRGVHLGDTVLGIKGRVGFEAPAAHLLIGAHRELEKLVLTGRQLFWKESLGNLYGSLLHEGHYFDPATRDVEAFLASTQQRVSGDVRVTLRERCFSVDGVRSPHSMMDARVASYGESNTLWTGEEARGFAKLYGVPQVLARRAAGGDA
jgi:argininosuccinate synthase